MSLVLSVRDEDARFRTLPWPILRKSKSYVCQLTTHFQRLSSFGFDKVESTFEPRAVQSPFLLSAKIKEAFEPVVFLVGLHNLVVVPRKRESFIRNGSAGPSHGWLSYLHVLWMVETFH